MKKLNRFAVKLMCCASLLACGDDRSPAADAGEPSADAATGAGLLPSFSPKQVDRSGLSNVGTDAPLDYDNPAFWVCRPDMDPNECHANLDATEIKSDGTLTVVPHVRAEQPAFDCFYVYPTVLLNSAAQLTDFTQAGVNLVLDPLLVQAARFSSACEVYAPLYRQVGLVGGVPAAGASNQLALQDVRDAFAYYLKNFNRGRNFVLLGHSQGSFMLTSMIARDLDDKPELRSRLISAILLGGQPYTPPGKLVGGSFQNIPLCSAPDQTGCVVAFNSYAAEAPPGPSAVFGKVGPGFGNEPADFSGQVACVNPAPLVGNQGRFAGSYFPLVLRNPSFGARPQIANVTTPFVLYRDLFRGACTLRDGYHYLQVSLEPPDGDTRMAPEYRSAAVEAVGFGAHLVDYNLALEDMIALVKRQAAAMK